MTHVERISTTGVGVRPPVATAPTRTDQVAATATGAPARTHRIDPTDPRYLALRNFAISMSIFNILGYSVFGFEQPWTWPLFALAIGYTTELVSETIAAWAGNRPAEYSGNGVWGVYTFLLPAHITSLAANMLLYANDIFWPIAFAVVVSVGQKYVLRAPIKGRFRHFMNPSNFGITITLVAFSWVNIAPPYHFTENVPDVIRIVIPVVILAAGTVLNAALTKKVGLIMGWAGGFVLQALIRHWIWDVSLWGALVPMTGVAFILFTNYMVTDPGTTPSRFRDQFMFGASVATVYGILMVFNIVYTLFFAVTIVCLARGTYWWMRWLRERRQERAAVPVAAVAQPAPA
jgi:hypothetical protein